MTTYLLIAWLVIVHLYAAEGWLRRRYWHEVPATAVVLRAILWRLIRLRRATEAGRRERDRLLAVYRGN